MRTLLLKELRELLLPALLAFGAMVLLALADVHTNRYRPQDLGTSLWFYAVLSIALALFGGANAIARESREQQVFLLCWPLSRRAIWAIKVAVSAGLLAAVAGLGYWCCVAIIGPQARQMLLDELAGPVGADMIELDFIVMVAVAYSLGLMWSGLVRSAHMTVGLAGLTAAVLSCGDALALRWVSQRVPPAERSSLALSLAICLAAAALLAAWAAHVRLPLLETRKRLWVCLAVLLALTVLSVSGVAVAAAIRWRP